jgi:hypothetical protein
LVYAVDVNIMGARAHTIKENAKALVAASKETGLQVHADKLRTRPCLEIRMQETSQYEAGNSSFERLNSSIFGNSIKKSKFYSGRV